MLNGREYIKIVESFQLAKSHIFILVDEFSPADIRMLMKSGVNGYFVKEESLITLKMALLNPNLKPFWMSKHTERLMRYFPENENYTNLTPREKEVFKLLAEGDGYKEAGYKLGINGKTVLVHRENLMKKMGFKNNTDLIKEALKLGIISLL